MGDGGLGCGTQNRGGVVVAREFFERSEARLEVADREALGFVENDNGVGNVVKFAGE